jgi:redox-sensitive bicupin YhaK (pirin superfamily)
MNPPRYQALPDASFPRTSHGGATGRLIAGTINSHVGPAKTHSPMTVLDLSFAAQDTVVLPFPEDWTVIAFCFDGQARAGEDNRIIPNRHFALFERDCGDEIMLSGDAGSRILVLAGEPLNESVVAYGPFVMNTTEEIQDAMRDYERGAMGKLGPAQGTTQSLS